MTQEALKLALEALENPWKAGSDGVADAITAIKEALAQPEQPKVRTGDCLLVGVCASEGHKIAPQRTWVGLTDEEIKPCWHEACQTDLELTSQLVVYFAKAIEAKLKDKNCAG